jgi:hypothetical protein
LCERVLLEGKPTLRIVCRIARVFEDRIDETSERDRFWHAARHRLGRLRRLSARDVCIEGEIAKRVLKPQPVLKRAREDTRALPMPLVDDGKVHCHSKRRDRQVQETAEFFRC